MYSCKPRIESFFKTRGKLVAAVKKWNNENKISGLNLTNKNKDDNLIADAKRIIDTVERPIDICVHFSVKYNWRSCGRSKDAQLVAGENLLRRWGDFYDEAGSVGIQRVLLISGSPPKKKVDSIELLKYEAARRKNNNIGVERARLGIAWTPCYPDANARSLERERLSQKLSTGVVDDIWLQFSSNVSLLHDELVWLREKHGIDGRNGPVKLFGSMFVPTPVWLNRFRFRPWNGVFVDANFLSNVESAQQGAKSILKVYRAMNVSPLIESPSLKDIDIIRANDFLHSIMNNINDKNTTATKLFKKMKNEERKPIDTGDISIVEHETNPVVVLLRNELRLHDNPLLSYAASLRRPVCLLYVWAPEKNNKWSLENTACGIWLQESLNKLDLKLRDVYKNPLIIRHATSSSSDEGNDMLAKCVINFAQEIGSNYILLGERYNGNAIISDKKLIEAAHKSNINTKVMVTSALHNPSAINLSSGQKGYFHWGTLMPFLRACEKHGPVPQPLGIPLNLMPPSFKIRSDDILFVKIPHHHEDWGKKIRMAWPNIGEDSAQLALNDFISCTKAGLMGYEKKRSRADIKTSTARLSPHLRFGEISPRSVYWAVKEKLLDRTITKTFLRRLYWRDLAYFHNISFPEMSDIGIRKHYDETKWTDISSNPGYSQLQAWKVGKTGFPIVDAGMRELHATGWMNQSVRMVVASFLCEVLNIDWRHGEKHFHQELIDTDISINAMMWQNAGRSGIDQWNFFMSPVNASQDPTGNYTKKWVPELQKLPLKFLHNPWNAPSNVLVNAGVILGSTYPKRICLDITTARNNSKTAVLEMRRDNQAFNDEGGYDVILLPDGSRSRVFTRRDLRLNRDGSIKVFKGKKRTKNEGKKAKKKTKNKIAKDNNQKSITSFFAISTTTASKKIKS